MEDGGGGGGRTGRECYFGEKGGCYLLNIVVRAYQDDVFRAIPCIFSLCRQIRNTRLVDQPVVLSWRSKLE